MQKSKIQLKIKKPIAGRLSLVAIFKRLTANRWSLIASPAAKRQEGYTFIEMLIVFAIVAMLSGMIMTNYVQHRKEEVLINETYKVAQLIRRAQNLALSPRDISDSVGTLAVADINSYGVYFDVSSNKATLFADDKDSGNQFSYDAGQDRISDELVLSKEVKIGSVDPASLNISFEPPDPTTRITGEAITATIRVELIDDSSRFKTVEVNATGLVEVK